MRMNESYNFFSDPKVIISLLALIVSIVALIWTLANQSEQNRRWEKLNDPNPVIKEINMTSFKEITKEDALKTKWGYEPHIYAKGEATNLFSLPYFLSLHDLTTNERLTKVNPIFTIDEIEPELKRIGYTKEVTAYRYFKPKFTIENMGKTSTENLSIKVDAKLPGQEWLSAFTSNSKISLSSGQVSTFFIELELPLNIELPKHINFRINLNWKDIHSKSVSRLIDAKWTTNDNFWSYGNDE